MGVERNVLVKRPSLIHDIALCQTIYILTNLIKKN